MSWGKQQSIIDLATHYRQLSSMITPYVNEKANALGFEVTSATIENIGLPLEVEKLIDEQSGIGLAARIWIRSCSIRRQGHP